MLRAKWSADVVRLNPRRPGEVLVRWKDGTRHRPMTRFYT